MTLHDSLTIDGYRMLREIPGRGITGIFRFVFTTGIVTGIDEFGYTRRWCYENHADAVQALNTWNGEGDPPGDWIKSKGDGGEYSNPKLLPCPHSCGPSDWYEGGRCDEKGCFFKTNEMP